jgi:HEPN domain-containing protein
MMSLSLDHLPRPIRQELRHVCAIVMEEFGEAMRGKQAPHRKAGRILKVILHGSFAHPNWHCLPSCDGIDLLAIVNHDELADGRHWRFALVRLRGAWETGEIAHPVRLAVHGLSDINRVLADGLPFFTTIIRDGIVLHELDRTPLATPRRLSPPERCERGRVEFNRWYPKAGDFLLGADFYQEQGNAPMAAALLHQACEHLYQCVTWTLTLHGRRTHALDELRGLAETQDPRLCTIWPRTDRFERRCFARIRRAYVEARYAPSFTIRTDELAWAMERTVLLHGQVGQLCRERLDIAGDRLAQL